MLCIKPLISYFGKSNLENLDLTGSAVYQPISIVGFYLQSEWYALLATVLPSGEFCADTMNTKEHCGFLSGVPYTFKTIYVLRVNIDIRKSV